MISSDTTKPNSDPYIKTIAMSCPKIKIAIIGTGLIGPRHAQAVQEEDEAELTCIVDPSPAAEAVAVRLGVPLYRTIRNLINSNDRPDAAIVCTPNHTHVALSEELLDHGIHVLVEKPISTDIVSGQKLISRPARQNLHLLVGHHRRFNPYVRAAKSLLEAKSLGRVIAICGIWGVFKPASYFEEPTTWRRYAASGGVILINLIHEVDILQYLLGPIIRVHAEGTINQRNFEAEEGAAIILRFASGVVGTFILSDAVTSPWSFEHGTGENPTIPRSGEAFLRILGSDASVSLGDMKRWSYDEAGPSWTNIIQAEDVIIKPDVPFKLQVKHFVNVVRGEEKPVCSAEDGLRALIVCEAIKRSITLGKPINISDITNT
ncbi:NAD(P)-binding protein [Eremomyces bilateralis CBS 781.70]|uniref:NAD(P)-binding protein n=1 Tax=Eremomyces bilateralis CBS 781.70 TaxID=1392243 RepID=A0A6G1FXK5_9PEZI|nr:NAD(P)-binding protein [Eremomyces bilateralis CBS 781.70]KAF1810442.1 NAD(P)-binding protein [Eremomyces bilateralis CBS 781.70]